MIDTFAERLHTKVRTGIDHHPVFRPADRNRRP
jgi:hypothetical protein